MTTFSLLSNLLTSGGIVLLVYLFLLLNRYKVEKWSLFVQFAVCFAVIRLLYLLGDDLQVRLFPSLQYAWVSKLLSLAFVIGVYLFFQPVLFRQFGWKVQFDKRYLRPTLVFSLALILFKCITNYLDPSREAVTAERWLYQLSLPGLEEEIVFRGLFFVLFKEMLVAKEVLFGKKIAPEVLVVTLLFALVHSFQLGVGQFSFDWVLFISSGFAGYVYMWLRVRHESLAPPVVCHNAVNTLITFVQWIK